MGVTYIDSLDDSTGDAEQNDWRGGFDEFATPTMLAGNAGGRGVNVIIEDNGRPRNRPGADGLSGAAISVGNQIESLFYFDTPTLEYVLAAANNTVQQWDGSVWTTPAGYPFGANTVVAWAQIGERAYATSGTGQWYYYDGAAWSAGLGTDNTTAAGDPAVGATILCVHTNRVFAAGVINNQYDVLAASALGDGGANVWDWLNFSLRIGRGEGERITALCSAKGQWLAVGKEGSIFMVYTPPSATTAATWIVQRLASSVGVVGRKALVAGGDSLWCIGPDLALREIRPTQVEDTPFELLPAASEPAKPYFDRINTAALSKVALHVYGRYLVAALPLDNATAPSHVLVWNLRLRVASQVPGFTIPAFVGVWTGWTPTSFLTSRFSGIEALLIGDAAGYVNKWKDKADQTLEGTFKDNGAAVLATVRTRSWDFGTQRNAKDAESLEVFFFDSSPQVDIVAVMDGVEQRRWTVSMEQTQNSLPVSLPFDLAVLGPTRATRNADMLAEFREMYVEIQQLTAGRLEVKSITAAAFLNTVDNE
jgi:hypothetical protein